MAYSAGWLPPSSTATRIAMKHWNFLTITDASASFQIRCAYFLIVFRYSIDNIGGKQTGLLLTNCKKEDLKLDVSKLYRLTPFKNMIAISNSTGIILYNDEDDLVLNDIREVSLIVSNVKQVKIYEKTFDRIVINIVFHNILNLSFAERSFTSCWGTAWIFNNSVPVSIQPAFSSSDMVVYKDTGSSFTIHARPRVTPRQRIKLVYQLAAEVNDLSMYFSYLFNLAS